MFLSIIGMYEYDSTIFRDLTVPEGIDKNILINNILLECAELEIVYPNIDTMKIAIGAWSASNAYKWETLYKTTQLSYNPIWNVDADIEETVTSTKGTTQKTTFGKTETRTVNLKDELSHGHTETRTIDITDEETVDLTSTESVKGFNSTSWSESKKVEQDGTDTFEHDGTDTMVHTGKDTTSHTGTDTMKNSGSDSISGSENENIGTVTRRTGNIGVTTTQKMILEEREIAEFSIINYITLSFKERFCILVY